MRVGRERDGSTYLLLGGKRGMDASTRKGVEKKDGNSSRLTKIRYSRRKKEERAH